MLLWMFDIKLDSFNCTMNYGGFERKSSLKNMKKKSSFYVIVNVKKNSNIFKEISLWWGSYISENEISIEWVTSLHPFLWGVFILLVNFERIVTRSISKIVSFSSFLHYARFYSLSLSLLNRPCSPVSESLSVLRVVAVAQLLPPSLSLFLTAIIKSVTFCQN